jgi:hypothetical protein
MRAPLPALYTIANVHLTAATRNYESRPGKSRQFLKGERASHLDEI